MRKKFFNNIFLLLMIAQPFLFSIDIIAQSLYKQLRLAYNFSYMNTDLYNSILNEANDSMYALTLVNPSFKVDQYYQNVESMRGFGLSFSVSNDRMVEEFGYLNKHAVVFAEGTDNITSIDNYWGNKKKLEHMVFYIGVGWILINAEAFRLTSGFHADFAFLTTYKKGMTGHSAYSDISKTFVIGATPFLDISVGKKFFIFFKPLVQFPFWKHNIWKFKEDMNPETASNYTRNDFFISTFNYGFAFGIGIGGR